MGKRQFFSSLIQHRGKLLLYNRILLCSSTYCYNILFRLENDFYLGPPTLLRAHTIYFFSSPVIRIIQVVYIIIYRYTQVYALNRFFSIYLFFPFYVHTDTHTYILYYIPYRMSSLIKFGIAVNYLAKSCCIGI